MTTAHAIVCKRTGEPLGVRLDGGTCACPSADKCAMAEADHPTLEPAADGQAIGEA